MKGDIPHSIYEMAKNNYKGCLHCAWYSLVFYNKGNEVVGCSRVMTIKNNEDFEKVKKQFVNHMNRSHPDICKKKQMKYIENKEKFA